MVIFGFCLVDMVFFRPVSDDDDNDVVDGNKTKINRIINNLVIGHHVQ
jgi:hypothetical protein